jgi:hypothetical protein
MYFHAGEGYTGGEPIFMFWWPPDFRRLPRLKIFYRLKKSSRLGILSLLDIPAIWEGVAHPSINNKNKALRDRN